MGPAGTNGPGGSLQQRFVSSCGPLGAARLGLRRRVGARVVSVPRPHQRRGHAGRSGAAALRCEWAQRRVVARPDELAPRTCARRGGARLRGCRGALAVARRAVAAESAEEGHRRLGYEHRGAVCGQHRADRGSALHHQPLDAAGRLRHPAAQDWQGLDLSPEVFLHTPRGRAPGRRDHRCDHLHQDGQGPGPGGGAQHHQVHDGIAGRILPSGARLR
mmetsp:Transcript_38204/g.122862  ORF Transcript_38204/g.122862 Transcript_38204/m.122862 type:complete len:218 (+) Transcript_38204:526-1179(+)